MSESKFTPGPWHVGDGNETIVYDANRWAIASATTFHRKHEDGSSEANAKLIAAAPELLEALEALKREIILSDVNMDYIDSHFKPWLDKARAAIHKATA